MEAKQTLSQQQKINLGPLILGNRSLRSREKINFRPFAGGKKCIPRRRRSHRGALSAKFFWRNPSFASRDIISRLLRERSLQTNGQSVKTPLPDGRGSIRMGSKLLVPQRFYRIQPCRPTRRPYPKE